MSQMRQILADALQNNLGNRLTPELANGLLLLVASVEEQASVPAPVSPVEGGAHGNNN